jgi:spore coat polysaccharide biosynthesis predicted glycosyltransferase SpsG
MNIALTTYFNPEHGIGHLSRIRILLNELKLLGIENKLYIQCKDLDCLKIAQRYFKNQTQSIIFFLSSEKKTLSDENILIIDSIKKTELILNYKVDIKIISLSPLYENNNDVDYIFSRGKTNVSSDKVTQIIGSEYGIFKNLPISKTAKEKRLVLHVGGGKDKQKILSEIIYLFKNKDFLSDYKIIIFDENPSHFNDIITERFSKFMFSPNDLIVTSGGLSFSEAANSGLKTLNFFINKEHMNVSDKSLEVYKNVLNIGTLEELKDFDGSELNKKIKSLFVQRYRSCMGSKNIVNKIKEIVNG